MIEQNIENFLFITKAVAFNTILFMLSGIITRIIFKLYYKIKGKQKNDNLVNNETPIQKSNKGE